ncbi:DUF134 domain-containing protein [Megasphaera vaginalis (ex Bordigoni et al. 2020)]|uniref:DUF134 domain-containing protein n=1 Tax=Megasphaera vaginalis (ex Bordigoni et al. 2020) TaxID=2045301 RepID=UPI000C7AD67D|nr:DUF134 domain-containing protein [Megasphaera vaginalis (ex Bordigoni et al. 2020)]
MARPSRCRKVCALPQVDEFLPADEKKMRPTVVMTVDEYEVIRLIDLVGLTQAQCAVQIAVSRTTVTGIYETARRKLADVVIHGKRLLIEGGNIKTCQRAATCRALCCRAALGRAKGDDRNE